MSIELVTKYSPLVDEVFKAVSKTALVTNQDYDWTGAHTVKVYKVSTAPMNDYKRTVTDTDLQQTVSRYGAFQDLSAESQEMVLSNDRSFSFNIDTLDEDETATALEAQSALNRQLRNVVIPERDKSIFAKMVDGAGIKAAAKKLSAMKLYDELLAATEQMDEAEVPDTERVLIVTPKVYAALKKELQEVAYNDLDANQRASGIIGYIDGMTVVKVPSNILPENFGFMIAHPSATVAPVKLADYGIYSDTPLSSGTIVVGRFAYDTFVLDNKKNGIYYQALTPETGTQG